jgi:hypothetical protein
LCPVSCKGLYSAQPDRFAILGKFPYQASDFNDQTPFYHCESYLAAKYVQAYLATKGRAMILFDESEYDLHYCVVADYELEPLRRLRSSRK